MAWSSLASIPPHLRLCDVTVKLLRAATIQVPQQISHYPHSGMQLPATALTHGRCLYVRTYVTSAVFFVLEIELQ